MLTVLMLKAFFFEPFDQGVVLFEQEIFVADGDPDALELLVGFFRLGEGFGKKSI